MPHYRHPELKSDFEKWELPVYAADREHPVVAMETKALHYWLFFLGPTLSVPFVLLLFVLPHDFSLRDIGPDSRVLLSIAVLSFIGNLFPLFFNPGYAAPVTAAIYALLIKALMYLRRRIENQQIGQAFSRLVPVVCLLLLLARTAARPLHISVTGARTWASLDLQLRERANLEATLSHLNGGQLVIVRRPRSDPSSVTEWVFNDADIDHSKIVWAHDMGPEENAELIRYFEDRKVWLVEPNTLAARITPYVADASTKNPEPRYGLANSETGAQVR